jgi:hypothetical protein
LSIFTRSIKAETRLYAGVPFFFLLIYFHIHSNCKVACQVGNSETLHKIVQLGEGQCRSAGCLQIQYLM